MFVRLLFADIHDGRQHHRTMIRDGKCLSAVQPDACSILVYTLLLIGSRRFWTRAYMAKETHHIHDKLTQQVLGQPASAASLLQRYLPEAVSQALDWPSLRRLNRSFVDGESCWLSEPGQLTVTEVPRLSYLHAYQEAFVSPFSR